MRKKIAVLVVLATFAFSTGSMYSHLLHAEQHAASELSSTYTIVPGGNVTHTYDFSSNATVDRWAYRDQASSKPPSTNETPATAFTTSQYTRIEADDTNRQVDQAANGYHAAHRFVFSIAENRSNITSIHILWNGRGEIPLSTDGAVLYLWNSTASSYDQLDDTTVDTEATLEANTSASTDYVASDGNLTVLVVQQRPTFRIWIWIFRSEIATDYVKVDVTHTGGT